MIDSTMCVCVCVWCVYCCSLVAQSCPTLCEHWDHSLPGSSVPVVSHTRILECVAISSSRGLPNPGSEPASPANLLHCRWILHL